MDLMDLIEEFEKYLFKRKPMNMEELKKLINEKIMRWKVQLELKEKRLKKKLQ